MNHEIAKVNLHLPAKVINLKIALKLEKSGYYNRQKQFITFSKSELELMSKAIPAEYHNLVELPMFLTRRRDQGAGVYIMGGTKYNVYLMRKALDEELPNIEVWNLRILEQSQRIIYRHQIVKIRKMFPTTTVQAFA